jgi:hypothetical protein
LDVADEECDDLYGHEHRTARDVADRLPTPDTPSSTVVMSSARRWPSKSCL